MKRKFFLIGFFSGMAFVILVLVGSFFLIKKQSEKSVAEFAAQPGVANAEMEVFSIRREALDSLYFYDIEKKESLYLSSDTANFTFINYWATWCIPCVGEMPELASLINRQEIKDAPIKFIFASRAGLNVASALENLESIKSYYDHTASKSYKILLHRFMSDTTNTDQPNQALIDLLSIAQNLDAYYHLAFLQLKSGNYNVAENVLSNIPVDLDLSSNQLDEYNAMQMYFNIRKQMHQNGQMVGAATTEQLSDLLLIAENDWGMASSYAQSVLFANDMWETVRPDEDGLKSAPAKADEYYRLKAIGKKSNALQIAPCPASDFIIVKHSSEGLTGNSTLEIHGINGKLIKQLSIDGTSFEKVVNVSDLPPSNYIISLFNNGKWIESSNFTVVN